MGSSPPGLEVDVNDEGVPVTELSDVPVVLRRLATKHRNLHSMIRGG